MILNSAAERHGRSPALSSAPLLIALLLPGAAFAAQSSATAPENGLVARALAQELQAAQDTAHPMRYRLRKTTPRLSSTKEIVETRDGAVARLLSVNGETPSAADRQKDEARLNNLLADPSRQRKRKQGEQEDMGRVLKVLRALPKAFIYQYAGSTVSGSETFEKYTFTPNPRFNPSDLELLVLTAMAGELTVDSAHQRVVRLEGHLQQDVDIGWGIIGRLNKGGWIVIQQADIGGGQWRIVHFQMAMTARVFFKTRTFDTTEEESEFVPVPIGMTYQQAIQFLRSESGNASRGR